MSNFKFELDRAGVRELLQSDEIKRVLEANANAVIKKCEGNYETNTYTGRNRANVTIRCADVDTYFKNLQNNELLKAMP